ncbi:MAG: hypothetical protein Q8K50_06365 [Hydrogenophaga sp.]|uniref:hypothetical protein n=1 Tax=Hydrogenophaga sp. TaxID=1904254 RepID=UPI002733642D|nr:hypothetical protein [Hydrogenophaga sp.]MDP2093497.1 hypothetical protein [Hydrogenophaga sp.]MDP3346683.1 hypothetical protein [Hydrogenophaga sp.]MDP3922799.1 hypothetical protein [Hydrogenophaga sp.]
MNLNVVFIPKDINFTPTEDAVEAVSQYLEDAVGDSVDFVDVGIAPRLFFVDEGDTWLPTIGCSSCGTEMQTHGEHADWVQAFREELISNQSLDLNSYSVAMPCCGKETLVKSLDFGGKAGFARFSATLEGADIEGQEDKIAEDISRLIGSPIAVVELVST